MDKLSTDGNKAKDSVIIFDGKDPNRAAKWFELSQATERFAEYHCGTPGVEIWLGVSPVLTEENVTEVYLTNFLPLSVSEWRTPRRAR